MSNCQCWLLKKFNEKQNKQKIFPPKLFLENSDYLEKWNLQLAKFPNFCCQNIMSYPNYQILFLSTDEIVRKNIYHNKCKPIFFITKIVFSKQISKFLLTKHYVISQLSNPISKYRWNCQKIVYHNTCKRILLSKN